MALYHVRQDGVMGQQRGGLVVKRGRAYVAIAAMLIIVSIPLTFTSFTFAQDTAQTLRVQPLAERWAAQIGWKVVSVNTNQGQTSVEVTGPLPLPETAALESALSDAGIDAGEVHTEFIPSYTAELSTP